MSTPHLPFLKTSPQYIFFTDFDGTITQQDSNDFLVENYGLGPVLRKKLFQDVLHGRRTFRDVFKEMLDSVSLPLDQCIAALLENIRLDEGFKEFYEWAKEHNVPVVVLSGGMEPLIRALLGHLLGEEEVRELVIMSNGVVAREGKEVNGHGGWEIEYRDER
jgi:2,3-diketo-5-methylthio-1-phosphopentane phosphatase